MDARFTAKSNTRDDVNNAFLVFSNQPANFKKNKNNNLKLSTQQSCFLVGGLVAN